MRAWSLSPLLLLLATGCEHFMADEPQSVGEPLGTFRVAATETHNECGQGALGIAPTWEFDVVLSREEERLLWDNGYEIITGTLGEDGSTFLFQTGIRQNMRTEESPYYLPACEIDRTDLASGTLDSPDGEVIGFGGELSYRFAPTEGSDCTDLFVGETRAFLTLPCTVAFDITAERSVAPDP